MKAKIRLTIEVDYETNGTPICVLKDQLFYSVGREATTEGRLTGIQSAEVEQVYIQVEYLP